jgi:hypothetical protein
MGRLKIPSPDIFLQGIGCWADEFLVRIAQPLGTEESDRVYQKPGIVLSPDRIRLYDDR